MIGIAGWVAALFVLGFVGVGMSNLFNSPMTAMVIGLVMCVAAAGVFHAMAKVDFMVQFAFAASVAGQAAFALGLLKDWHDSGAGWLALAGFQAVLLLVIEYPVHRVWSAFAAAVAVLIALHQWSAEPLFPGILAAGLAILLLGEARLVRHAPLAHSTAVGLASALLVFVPSTVWMSPFALGERHPSLPAIDWLGAALAGAVLVVTVGTILARRRIAPASPAGVVALTGTLLFAVVASPFPALVASLVLVLVAFECGHRALLGLGLVAAGGMFSYYYYSLHASLLQKSFALLGMGAGLLATAAALRRWWSFDTGRAGHA